MIRLGTERTIIRRVRGTRAADSTGLTTAVCSIVATRRRRYFWAAWWTGPPGIKPFRKPDASNGGAATEQEALLEAEAVARRQLSTAPPYWARAWNRILRGEPPFTARELAAASAPKGERAPRPVSPESASNVLGVQSGANVDELRKAYRKRALETHPDRGGHAEAFLAVQRSYERLVARAKKPRRKAR